METSSKKSEKKIYSVNDVGAFIAHIHKQESDFNLSGLQFFSPLLLQFYEPEFPQRFSLETGRKIEENLELYRELYLQYYDLFDAMRFAEANILPNLTPENINLLQPDQIIEWLNNIHKKVGYTIVRSQGLNPGKYCDLMMLRWHATIDFFNDLLNAWESCSSPDKTIDENLRRVFQSYGYSDEVRCCFFRLLEKFVDDDSINIAKYFPNDISDNMSSWEKCILSLAVAYHTSKLTNEEIKLLDQVVIIVQPLEERTKRMEYFSAELLSRLKQCRCDDVAVSQLVAWVYFQITDIHTYSNANKRLATIMCNCILNYFKYPSIVFQTPELDDDENSSYNVAIRLINKDLSHLERHIEQQITISRQDGLQLDKKELALIQSKVVLAIHYDFIHEFIENNDFLDIDGCRKIVTNFCREQLMQIYCKSKQEKVRVEYIIKKIIFSKNKSDKFKKEYEEEITLYLNEKITAKELIETLYSKLCKVEIPKLKCEQALLNIMPNSIKFNGSIKNTRSLNYFITARILMKQKKYDFALDFLNRVKSEINKENNSGLKSLYNFISNNIDANIKFCDARLGNLASHSKTFF